MASGRNTAGVSCYYFRVKTPLHALVIDDEEQMRNLVSEILESDGWAVTSASTAERAFSFIGKQEWDLVISDVVLGGDVDGFEVMRRFTEHTPNSRFVLMTGYGSGVGALDATSMGAYEYLVKPFSVDQVLEVSRNVRRYMESKAAARGLRTPAHMATSDTGLQLVGKSRKFIECLKLVGRVSKTDLPVLITGESGTGKEVVARSIHQRSERSGRKFVPVNCGAIPTELIESELFGHIKGSFTGADSDRVGMWEEANGGTIFLDEITETSPLFQVKLLRTLQQREIRRVGSNKPIPVDVRVIAATNRNIEREVAEGRFREDLMYRLNAVMIELPPLRERLEDIMHLAEFFAMRSSTPDVTKTFSKAAQERLTNYDWPGNIRELENAILRAAALTDNVICPEHLPPKIQSGSIASVASDNAKTERIKTLAEVSAEYAAAVLEKLEGNKQAASRALDIDRKTLNRILDRASRADQ